MSRLCIRLGFCLPLDEIEKLSVNPPAGIDEFVVQVLAAEGYAYTYTRSDALCGQVRDEVERAFARHLENGRHG